ncbi:MAG: biotin--[acetyl-CoA-carboxylase] ligase [Clostridia bacterium]|nr:biotin--[acetyl-CoA-carboxylase] ligase [Clostridia bacterium]
MIEYAIEYLSSIDSTNTYLKKLAQNGALEGKVVVAREQSAGRGRNGRSFFSSGGLGIYMSILLRPNFSMQDASRLTCLAAVAVARAIEPYSKTPVGIKWVNDIFIGGKKVCGILTESASADGRRPEYVVVGIGLNLCAPPEGFPPEIKSVATALFEDMRPAKEAYEPIIRSVLDNFYELYQGWDERAFILEYAERSILKGCRVSVDNREGIVLRIDERCRLCVRFDDGEELAIASGEAVSPQYPNLHERALL